jgi:hypothetical protein
MFLWDESYEFEDRKIFLSTDMMRVFINVSIHRLEERQFSLPISTNPRYIAWLMENWKNLDRLYHDGKWFEEQQGKYHKEIDRYYRDLCKMHNIPV